MREIECRNVCSALKFDRHVDDRHVDNDVAEVPVKFEWDQTILDTYLAASKRCDILQLDVLSDIETRPRLLFDQQMWRQ